LLDRIPTSKANAPGAAGKICLRLDDLIHHKVAQWCRAWAHYGVRNQLRSEIAVNQLLMQSRPSKPKPKQNNGETRPKKLLGHNEDIRCGGILPTNPGNEPLTSRRNSSNNWQSICMWLSAALHLKLPFPYHHPNPKDWSSRFEDWGLRTEGD